MKALSKIDSFPLTGTAVHVAPRGGASLLQDDEIRACLARRPAGYVVGVFPITNDGDVHSEMWEMHPAGDEVLIMLAGALTVEYGDGVQHADSFLDASHGLVVPAGVWHRLLVREPGLLLALSPPQGTQFSTSIGRFA